MTKYRIIVRKFEGKDSYDEDDNGNETHSIEGVPKIDFVDCGPENLQKKAKEILEANADNPPYDYYHIIAVYDIDTMEIIPTNYWNREVAEDMDGEY